MAINGKIFTTNFDISSLRQPKSMRFENFKGQGQFKVDYMAQPTSLYLTNTWQSIEPSVDLTSSNFQTISINLSQEQKFYAVIIQFEIGGDLTFGWGYKEERYVCFVQENNNEPLVDNIMIGGAANAVSKRSSGFNRKRGLTSFGSEDDATNSVSGVLI